MKGKGGQSEQEREVIRMYRAGVPVEEIRVTLHVGGQRIFQIVKDSGTPMRGRGGRIGLRLKTDPEKLRQAVVMYRAGERIATIKRSLHIAERTLYAALDAAGEPKRHPRSRKNETPRFENRRLRRAKPKKQTTTNIMMLQRSYGADFVELANRVLARELAFQI